MLTVMEEDLTLCAAAFIRNKGKNVFTESDMLMGMSMDLRWMSYTDARNVMNAMIRQGVLEKNGELLRAGFDFSAKDVPVAYKPSKQLIASVSAAQPAAKPAPQPVPAPEPEASAPAWEYVDMMPVLMQKAVDSGIARRDFITESNSISRSLNIYIEAAALFVLRDHGVDISDMADRVYEAIALK